MSDPNEIGAGLVSTATHLPVSGEAARARLLAAPLRGWAR